MGRDKNDDGPSLAEAWALLAAQLGLQVELAHEDAIRVQGTVRGRSVTVAIERKKARSTTRATDDRSAPHRQR